eukprot:355371-Chlamydomonas_euryale.AAC.4
MSLYVQHLFHRAHTAAVAQIGRSPGSAALAHTKDVRRSIAEHRRGVIAFRDAVVGIVPARAVCAFGLTPGEYGQHGSEKIFTAPVQSSALPSPSSHVPVDSWPTRERTPQH